MNPVQVGATVLVFTASGTFRGQRGVVERLSRDGGAFVLIEGERLPVDCKRTEMITTNDDSGHHLAGAE